LFLFPAVILVLIGLGLFLAFRGKDKINAIITSFKKPSAVPIAPLLELSEPKTEPENNRGYGVTLRLEFPEIETTLPDVWGLEEELEIDGFLSNSEMVPLAGKPLELYIGKHLFNMATDALGIGLLKCSFKKKGLYKLSAIYNGEPGIENAEDERLIRIVDYREEIVALYKNFIAGLHGFDIDLNQDATPREVHQSIKQSGIKIPEIALNKVIDIFEEANYSLHPISREQYEIMYLAQKEIFENENTEQEATKESYLL